MDCLSERVERVKHPHSQNGLATFTTCSCAVTVHVTVVLVLMVSAVRSEATETPKFKWTNDDRFYYVTILVDCRSVIILVFPTCAHS